MNNKYKYCIVVPCYNCSSTIDRTMESLINQQKTDDFDYQIILVDDGSCDETPWKCDGYASKQSIISVFHQTNKGLVGAWKRGVIESVADYISFCDADDYIDLNYLCRIDSIVSDYLPDMICYGMISEYDNGRYQKCSIHLENGYYDRGRIEKEILPYLLFDKDMESRIIGASRCTKTIKKELLFGILDDIPDCVSYGEDDVATFLLVQKCSNLYSVDYYPYHYVRNANSMIGAYDRAIFEKNELLYSTIRSLSKQYNYQFPEQIEKAYFSALVLNIKKEISKNPYGYLDAKKRINEQCKDAFFSVGYANGFAREYGWSARLFVLMLHYRLYLALYFLVRFSDLIRGMNV